MIEHYLNFRDFFLPLPSGYQDSRLFISFSKERYACRLSQYFDFFFLEILLTFFVHESCQSICRVYLVFQDRVLRLMSHCFFPLKMYRFLLHTNRCQTFLMCTSCVSSSEHNYRSDFFKSIQSHFYLFISKTFFFLATHRSTTDKSIVRRTNFKFNFLYLSDVVPFFAH